MGLGTAGILCGWALQGCSVLGAAGMLYGGCWSLQGYCAVIGDCRGTWSLGSAGMLRGWALQGYSAAGHCMDTWWLGTADMLPGGTTVRLHAEGKDNIDLKIPKI